MPEFFAGVVLGFVVGALGGATMAIDMGRDEGRAALCKDQFAGILVEGKCVSRASLKPVAP